MNFHKKETEKKLSYACLGGQISNFTALFYKRSCQLQMPGGVAETTGKFRRGDHIIGVNGSELADCKQEEVVAALKGPSGAMKIKIKRFKK